MGEVVRSWSGPSAEFLSWQQTLLVGFSHLPAALCTTDTDTEGLSGGAWECLASSACGVGSPQEVFHKQDSSQSGYLNRTQLWAAVGDAGKLRRSRCWRTHTHQSGRGGEV